MRSTHFIRWVAKPAIFVLALVPLALLVRDALADALGPNPVEAIQLRTGDWALRFLLITLAVTPLRRLTGWNALIRLRRMLGLFAFFYAVLHFANYLWLDLQLDWQGVADDILKRPYITVGFASLVMLVPLAATSTDGMLRRLGGRNWRRLHRLVYPAALLATLHFLWLVKADLREPLIYLGVLVLLLALRLPLAGRARRPVPVRGTAPPARAPGGGSA